MPCFPLAASTAEVCKPMRLKDKVAIVTGAARGIGRATAELFAEEGCRVFSWDIIEPTDEGLVGNFRTSAGRSRSPNAEDSRGDLADRTRSRNVVEILDPQDRSRAPQAEDLRAITWPITLQRVDVSKREQIAEAVQQIMDQAGQIDILINNAGILRDRSLLKMTEEDWAASLAVNLSGVFNCTQAVVPHMKTAGYGRIISASSIVGMRGNFGQTNYSATKAGIIGMTKSWAIELGKYGITANAIAPGFTQTEMTASIPPEILAQQLAQVPAGFLAEPLDIAYGYLYLASEEARFVNGVCLNIDGGVAR